MWPLGPNERGKSPGLIRGAYSLWLKLWLILLGTYEILTDFAGENSDDVHNDNVKKSYLK